MQIENTEIQTSTVVGATAPSKRPRKHMRWTPSNGLLFVAPFLLCFLALVVAPLAFAAYKSLYSAKLVGGLSFVGTANYREAIADPRLVEGLRHVAELLVGEVPLMICIATVLALIIDGAHTAAPGLFRLGFFIPFAVPSVIAALMWGYFYGPTYGPIAQVARAIDVSAPNWLSASWIIVSTGNIVFWEFVGYNTIVLYAAMRTVPKELLESAMCDGAGPIRVAFSVKVPAIRPAISLLVVFSIIGTFQLFNEPSLLQTVAPSSIDSGFSPNLWAYNLAFTDGRVGLAAAVAFLTAAVTLPVSALFFFAQRGTELSEMDS